jgi:3-methyladenine DNA glycosylase AlkD
MWVRRTAILCQNRHKQRTDQTRLFDYCLRRADEREFFIRKAIGWALRQYAYTAPDAVRSFINAHSAELSPLSVREAAKYL